MTFSNRVDVKSFGSQEKLLARAHPGFKLRAAVRERFRFASCAYPDDGTIFTEQKPDPPFMGPISQFI
jgi:hypothetical protein